MKYLIPVTFLIGCGALANAADMQPTDSLFSAKELEHELQDLSSQSTVSFNLILNPGHSDYATCAGTYEKSVTEIRDKPVYFSDQRQRVIFSDGSRWVISSYGYFVAIARGITSGGFYANNNGNNCLPETSCNCMGPRYRTC
jgi:hypothetical protein